MTMLRIARREGEILAVVDVTSRRHAQGRLHLVRSVQPPPTAAAGGRAIGADGAAPGRALEQVPAGGLDGGAVRGAHGPQIGSGLAARGRPRAWMADMGSSWPSFHETQRRIRGHGAAVSAPQPVRGGTRPRPPGRWRRTRSGRPRPSSRCGWCRRRRMKGVARRARTRWSSMARSAMREQPRVQSWLPRCPEPTTTSARRLLSSPCGDQLAGSGRSSPRLAQPEALVADSS